MNRSRQRDILEEAVLDLLDPAKRISHSGEVILCRESEKTVGDVGIIDVLRLRKIIKIFGRELLLVH